MSEKKSRYCTVFEKKQASKFAERYYMTHLMC